MVSQKQLLTTNLNIIPSRINENIDTVIYSKLKINWKVCVFKMDM